jgi:hypothetical protein
LLLVILTSQHRRIDMKSCRFRKQRAKRLINSASSGLI